MKLVAVVLVVAACGKSGGNAPAATTGESRPANGKERGDCTAGACDPGLLCLSNLCVRPPPADCQAIADQLATMDLGNYAEPDERAPVIGKYKAACTTAMVSKEQGECIAKTTDQFSAAQCAPTMFPEIAARGRAGCAPALTKLRGALDKAMGGAGVVQGQVDNVGIVIEALRESCEQDNWPPSLIACMETVGDDTTAMAKCNALMPAALQRKLAERVSKAAASSGMRGPAIVPPPPPPPPPPSSN